MPHTPQAMKVIVETALGQMRKGAKLRGCAEAAGVAPATLKRWIDRYQEAGRDGLGRRKGSGRRSQLALDDAETAALRRYVLETGSMHLGIRMFAEDPRCPDHVRDYVLARTVDGADYAPALYRAARITPEARAKYLGKKAWTYAGKLSRRGTFEVMPDGSKREIEPGDWWEFDDMSWNQPFWFEVPQGVSTRDGKADALLEKFGVTLGRQSLMAQDLRSGKWLGVELIGRPRDAYRAEDILRFMRRLFDEYGMPRRGIRLERGVWKSRAITGQSLASMGEDEQEKLLGGIAELGLEVVYAWTSRQKGGIEGGFDHVQSVAGLLHARNIGRVRGEMEADTAAMLKVKRGQMHPRDAGFPSIWDFRDQAASVLTWLNAEPKHGRIQRGVPDETWQAAIQAEPLAPVPADKYHVFLPERRELTIRGGTVETTVQGQPLWFSNPDLMARLGTGYRVAVAFDPGDPRAGAAVFNDETGNRAHLGHRPGEYLGHADYDEAGPQFGGTGDDLGIQRRKAFAGAVAAAYAGTGIFGRRAVRAITARDGRGNAAEIRQDGRGLASQVEPQTESPRLRDGLREPETPLRDRSEPRSPARDRGGLGGRMVDPAMAAMMEDDDAVF